jgi:hypothetical protein
MNKFFGQSPLTQASSPDGAVVGLITIETLDITNVTLEFSTRGIRPIKNLSFGYDGITGDQLSLEYIQSHFDENEFEILLCQVLFFCGNILAADRQYLETPGEIPRDKGCEPIDFLIRLTNYFDPNDYQWNRTQ